MRAYEVKFCHLWINLIFLQILYWFMIKIRSSESFGFDNSQEKKICISEGSHTMNKNFRELVALPSIAHYRSVSFDWLYCTYVSSSFRSLTFLGWSRKTKELLLRLVMDSKAGHGRERVRNAKLNWPKHVKRRQARKWSNRWSFLHTPFLRWLSHS